MCCCSPFSAVVVDLVAICICHVALHLVFHNCSDLPSEVSIDFFKNLLKVDQPFASHRVFTTH